MHDKKDISDLLEDVQAIVQDLRDEKADLQNQMNGLKTQLSMTEEEKTKVIRKLEETISQLNKELQDTKVQLARELQDTQKKLDQFHPELQSLQDELQNADLQNNLLDMEISKKNEEIKSLEDRLSAYTSLAPTTVVVEEPIA